LYLRKKFELKKTMKYLAVLFLWILSPSALPAQTDAYESVFRPHAEFKDQRNGKYVLDSSYYFNWNPNTEIWDNFEKYRITSRNSYGNILQASLSGIDPQTNEWIEKKRYEGVYYDSVTLQEWTAEIWDAKAGNWKMSDSIFYTIYGKPEKSWIKFWDETKFRFSAGKKVNYQYNDNQQIESEAVERFDTLSGSWKNDHIVSYTYDENSLLYQKHFEVWQNDGTTQDSLLITNNYNEQLLLSQAIFETWTTNKSWQPFKKEEFLYNQNQDVTEKVEYAWSGRINDWEERFFWRYSYDDQNLLTQVLLQYWEDFYYDWLFQSRTTYNYNQQGFQEQILRESYDPINLYWYNVSSSRYSYDEHGNRLEFIYRIWDDEAGIWLDFYKTENWWSYFEPASIFHPEKISLMVFPNPSSGAVKISISEPFTQGFATIFNCGGMAVKSIALYNQSTLLDLSSLPNGTYIIRLDIDGEIVSIKVIVR
jgi:hypothetical protein